MFEEREGSNLGGESQEVRDVVGRKGESESEREERGKREFTKIFLAKKSSRKYSLRVFLAILQRTKV